LWPHRRRLPLGDGFAGCCAARAKDACCADESLRLHCNLGYAEMGSAGCVHLPAEREFDAVRFWLSGDGGAALRVQFVCERGHRPAWCGELRYDRAAGRWIAPPDARLKHLAEAAVRAWIERRSETL
jgi:hypothetical protein